MGSFFIGNPTSIWQFLDRLLNGAELPPLPSLPSPLIQTNRHFAYISFNSSTRPRNHLVNDNVNSKVGRSYFAGRKPTFWIFHAGGSSFYCLRPIFLFKNVLLGINLSFSVHWPPFLISLTLLSSSIYLLPCFTLPSFLLKNPQLYKRRIYKRRKQTQTKKL